MPPRETQGSYTLGEGQSEDGSPARVLFATAEPTADGECLDRARAFSEALHAHLEVWCMGAGETPATSELGAQRRAGFVRRVAARARELRAILLILPGSDLMASQATALVRATGRPVLVARPSLASGAILAATDLSDAHYPIVRQASRLGALGRVSVVALHNVLPSCIELASRAPWPAALRPDPRVMIQQLQTLATAAREHHVSKAILTALIDPVDAILREARASRPDLVVVGTRPRRSGASRRRSVSAQLVNVLRQSVLIMPCSVAASRYPQQD